MSLELKLSLLTRISAEDEPDDYFARHYKYKSTIGDETVEYTFASRAALERWGGSELGYASQGDIVIVSRHLPSLLVPFVALHLLYTTLDGSELETRLGLDHETVSGLDYHAKEKVKLSIPLGIAAQYLDPRSMGELLDIYKKSRWAGYLDREILANLIESYNPDNNEINALITQEETERKYALGRVSARVTAHHHHRQVQRSRGLATASQNDQCVAQWFGSDITRADIALRALGPQNLTTHSVELCRMAEQMKEYHGTKPIIVDAKSSMFLYLIYEALAPPTGSVRKQRNDTEPFRFLEEREYQGLELAPGQNLVVRGRAADRFWESMHLRLQYVVDQQRLELEEVMKGATKLLGETNAGDSLAQSYAQRVLALIGPSILEESTAHNENTALVPVAAQLNDVIDGVTEIKDEVENALVVTSPPDETILMAMRVRGMLLKLDLPTIDVEELIRTGRKRKFADLATEVGDVHHISSEDFEARMRR